MAGRARKVCGQVFRYGIQTGRCERDAAADLRGALKSGKTEHFRILDIKELPGFLSALKENKARIYEGTRRAVLFSLLTFGRPKEIRMAQWSDIDLDAAQYNRTVSDRLACFQTASEAKTRRSQFLDSVDVIAPLDDYNNVRPHGSLGHVP